MGRAIALIILGMVAVLGITIGLTACSPQTGVLLGQIGQGGMDFEDTAVADYIVIAGKITDPQTKSWLNDYTVIPYLNGEEIAYPQTRTISHTGKYFESGEGVHDGCFVIYIPNRYELTASHVFVNANNEPVQMQYKDGGLTGRSDLYIWLGEVNPGDVFRLEVSEKQIEYAVAAMLQDNAHLDEKIHQSSTKLDAFNNITTQMQNVASLGAGGVPKNTSAPGWERPFNPSINISIDAVWEQYVLQHPTNMDRTTFAQEVLRVNPELAQTGQFIANQAYFLPTVP